MNLETEVLFNLHGLFYRLREPAGFPEFCLKIGLNDQSIVISHLEIMWQMAIEHGVLVETSNGYVFSEAAKKEIAKRANGLLTTIKQYKVAELERIIEQSR